MPRESGHLGPNPPDTALDSRLWDPLCRIFQAFGFDRCMWGTDWTRAVALLTYKEGVEAFRVINRLFDSDRAQLMGETLALIYNWSPSHDVAL
jgi:L-fuconolactonase